MLKRVISGGQTGADQAGLAAALAVGLRTGGTAPKGWRTEAGPNPALLRDVYGLTEHASWSYPPRTLVNIKDGDGTLVISRVLDGGSALTMDLCRRQRRPVLHVGHMTFVSVREVQTWLIVNKIVILNVAGNRESKSPGLQESAARFLREVFSV